MRNLIIAAIIVCGLGFYFNWKPSASGIANEMEIGETITYKGTQYISDWAANSSKINGYLRQKDRHYDKNMPIVTYDLILTSGDYNDPELVKIRNKGGGNYYWSAQKKPEGTLIVYHTVPSSLEAQNKLDYIDQGTTITLVGKISENSEIKGDSGGFVKLMHNNHKFILVGDAF